MSGRDITTETPVHSPCALRNEFLGFVKSCNLKLLTVANDAAVPVHYFANCVPGHEEHCMVDLSVHLMDCYCAPETG